MPTDCSPKSRACRLDRGALDRAACLPRSPLAMAAIVTAAMLVIGDEILSGRTKDKNIGHLADIMTAVGIDLKEVRIVADDDRRRSPPRSTRCAPAMTMSSPPAASGPPMTTSLPTPSPRHSACPALRSALLRAARGPLCAARNGVHRGPQAHGADAGRRRSDRQSRLGRARLSDRQCPCDGRRAGNLPGHARHCRCRRCAPAASCCQRPSPVRSAKA